MELSPRTSEGTAALARSGRRRALPIIVLALVVGALGVIVFMALDEATTYFYNADEAVDQRDTLDDSRFRLQGMVMDGVEELADGAAFDVIHNCVVVHVRHQGDPPQMFEPGIPAVVEGHWDGSGEHVVTDRLFVAHDAEYEAEDEYEERIEEAEEAGAYDLDDCPEVDADLVDAPPGEAAADAD